MRETDDVQTFYAFGVYEYEMGKTTDARTERSTYVVAGERVAVREQVSNPVSDELTWTFADNLGSASGFVNETTGETGAQRYYPFGHQWVASATDINPTDHGYTGQIRDGATGIYFYNARYYDQHTGRFLAADTIIPNPANPGDYNRYSYVRNNPINFNDPTGHCPSNAACYGDSLNGGVSVGGQSSVGVGVSNSYVGGPVNACPTGVSFDMGCTPSVTGSPTCSGQQSNFLSAANCGAARAIGESFAGMFDVMGYWHTYTHLRDSCAGSAMVGNCAGAVIVRGQIDQTVNNYQTLGFADAAGHAVPSVLLLLGTRRPSAAGPVAVPIPKGSIGGVGAGQRIPQTLRDSWFPQGQGPPTCSYCHTRPAEALDHVEPRSKGGDLTPDDIAPSCTRCNSSKGARVAPKTPPPEYVGAWPPGHWPERMKSWWNETYG